MCKVQVIPNNKQNEQQPSEDYNVWQERCKQERQDLADEIGRVSCIAISVCIERGAIAASLGDWRKAKKYFSEANRLMGRDDY